MDEADRAEQESAAFLKRALSAVSAARPMLSSNGYCHWCKEPVRMEGAVFCDVECRDDFDKHLSAVARVGRGA